MPALDYERFIKLMMLTTSSNDGEALNALRMANSYLARLNRTWEQVIREKLTIIEEAKLFTDGDLTRSPDRSEKFSDPDIDFLFDELRNRNISPSFRAFVDSVHEWWEQKGFLTEAQYRAIKKAVER